MPEIEEKEQILLPFEEEEEMVEVIEAIEEKP